MGIVENSSFSSMHSQAGTWERGNIGFDFPIDIVNYNTKDELLKNQIDSTGQKLF